MGIGSPSVNARHIEIASERGHVQVLYYWMDVNLRKRSQSSLVQVLVMKNSTLQYC